MVIMLRQSWHRNFFPGNPVSFSQVEQKTFAASPHDPPGTPPWETATWQSSQEMPGFGEGAWRGSGLARQDLQRIDPPWNSSFLASSG
jgi:hypothetical protein